MTAEKFTSHCNVKFALSHRYDSVYSVIFGLQFWLLPINDYSTQTMLIHQNDVTWAPLVMHNHRQLYRLFNSLMLVLTNQTWELHVTGPLWGESTDDRWILMTDGFLSYGADNAKSVSLSWRYHDYIIGSRYSTDKNSANYHRWNFGIGFKLICFNLRLWFGHFWCNIWRDVPPKHLDQNWRYGTLWLPTTQSHFAKATCCRRSTVIWVT